jgi:putative aldouronate transport system permease protein
MDTGTAKDRSRTTRRRRGIRPGSLAVDVLIYAFVGLLSLITLYPFIYIISCAFSDPLEVVSNSVWLYPIGFSTKAFERLFSSRAIWRAFGNSVFFTGVITFLNVGNSMLAGYVLAKPKLVFRKVFVVLIVITMYFSGGLIPSFINITRLGLYNSPLAIILPSILGIWNIILARTFIAGLPTSLKEAAVIEGAGELRVFGSLIVPLSQPIIAVLSLYTAVGVWNSWFSYMIYLPRRPELHPLQMFLTKVLIWGNLQSMLQLGELVDPELLMNMMLQSAVGAQLKYAVMVVASAPIIALYPFVQKYFIKGALLGSLKE